MVWQQARARPGAKSDVRVDRNQAQTPLNQHAHAYAQRHVHEEGAFQRYEESRKRMERPPTPTNTEHTHATVAGKW